MLISGRLLWHSRKPLSFRKSSSHLRILGARWVTWSKSHTGDSQFWSDLWTHSYLALSTCACNLTDIFLLEEETATIILKIMGATVQNLVAGWPDARILCTPAKLCMITLVWFLYLGFVRRTVNISQLWILCTLIKICLYNHHVKYLFTFIKLVVPLHISIFLNCNVQTCSITHMFSLVVFTSHVFFLPENSRVCQNTWANTYTKYSWYR